MSDTFIKKHREHAESKKLGRVECNYTVDKSGRFKRVHERADAAKRPPLVRQAIVPVGGGRGVKKGD